ncbi:MAG TPA: T9SS type A sorting domain-containing protein [Ignavibacteria bacterium]|nr:T9SS type A sorting domain-containing protein [Ignavibacteria bacterium]
MKTLLIFILAIISSNAMSQTVYTYYPINLNTAVNLNGANQNIIIGDNGLIFIKDYNGWNQVNSGTTENLNWINRTRLLLAGNNGVILRGGGANWVRIYTNGFNSNLNGVEIAASSYPLPNSIKFIAIGDNGMIISSSNQGVSWSQINSNTTENLNSFSSLGTNSFTNHIWIAANGGNIIRSTDAGSTWTKIYTGSNHNLYSVHFKDTANGITVGEHGIIKRSYDGGQTWSNIPSPVTTTLKCIAGTLNSSFLKIAGDNGVILKSTDFGITFTRDSTGFNTNLNSIYNIDTNLSIVTGNNGKAYQRQIDSLYLPWSTISGNNVRVYISNRGVIGQNTLYQNSPGFEWPVGSGNHLNFTSGITIAAKYLGALRMACVSFKGEYKPGYTVSGSFATDNRFKFYKVKKLDVAGSSYDYDNWRLMTPYGAPFVDVNHNGIFNPGIDKPGIQGAAETVFIALSDSDPTSHTVGEGFGGGTQPLYCDLRLTLWTYDLPQLRDAVFIKYRFINKSNVQWTNVHFGNFFDPDIGDATDDYIGCDTTRSLGFAYNADNQDPDYGANPPAFGNMFLKTPQSFGMNSYATVFKSSSSGMPFCVLESHGEPIPTYNFIRGYKKDNTPWMLHRSNPLTPIRYLFSGDPEMNSGWTMGKGITVDCGGVNPAIFDTIYGGDKRMLMNTGSENFYMNPNDTVEIVTVQFAARGSSNLNSVTRLKQLADSIRTIYESGFSVGINPISQIVPDKFSLYQNYPNPFNPITKIKFDVPKKSFVILEVFDVSGRLISTLLKEEISSGQYEVPFDANNLSSGVYFYRLRTDAVMISKKMLLLK